MQNCKVCDEKYNKSGRKRVRCCSCEYDQCQKCVKRYLLSITQIESKCMNCNVEWKRKFLKKNLPRTYLEGEYKEEQKKKIFDQERQHFPELMVEIEGYKRKRVLTKEQNENRDSWQEMRKMKEIAMSQRQIYSREIQDEMICPWCIQKQCGQKIEERVYRQVSKNFKREDEIIYCRKCEKNICQHCLKIKEEEHECVEKDENKVREVDEEIEEYEVRKKQLQEEYKEIQERIWEIERGNAGGRDVTLAVPEQRIIEIQNVGQQESKQQTQKNYYIHCPQKECNGYIDNKKDRCGVCESKICRRCNEEKTEDHECKDENIESAKKIRHQCRQCPGCKTQIYKIEGCNDMYCVICKISFNWRTGTKTNLTANPHYYEYLRQRNVEGMGLLQNIQELNQRFQELQNQQNCNNLVEGEEEIRTRDSGVYKQYLRRSRKIRLKLSKEQEERIQKWGDNYRYTYNRAVWYLNTVQQELSKEQLFDMVIRKEYNGDQEWLLETPWRIRESALDEAYRNREIDISKIQESKEEYKQQYMRKKQKIRKFTIKINKGQIGRVQEKTCKEARLDSKRIELFKEERGMIIQTREELPVQFGMQDIKLQYDGISYSIIVPITKKSKEVWMREKVCVLDPGMRVFQTLYNPIKNYYINLGEKSASSILYRLKILDKMVIEGGFESKKRRRLILKMMRRIRNLQKEQHNKIANYLCQNYSTIIIGDFKIKELKYGGVIRTQEARNMDTVGHKKFMQKLKSKAEEYKCNLIVQDEAWTSKRCCRCGNLKKDLGKAKVYDCERCGLKINRDLNGAINILKKQQKKCV